MAIFVFSTKKPMEIAAYMDEGMRNVVLVGGLLHMFAQNYHMLRYGRFLTD